MKPNQNSDKTAGAVDPATSCSPLALTPDRPSTEGWFWWEVPTGYRLGDDITYHEETLEVVQICVQEWDGELYLNMDKADGDNPLVAHIPGRWAGPIPLPLANEQSPSVDVTE